MKLALMALSAVTGGALYTLAQAPSVPTPTPKPTAPAASQTPSKQASSSDRGSATLSVGGKSIAIDYGRPALQGREPLKLAEVGGRPWRMGKDGATTLKTEAELTFGSVKVPAGTYLLTASRTGANTWNLNFNDKDRKPIVSVPLSAGTANPVVELFTIELNEAAGGGTFSMAWGGVTLAAPFTAK